MVEKIKSALRFNCRNDTIKAHIFFWSAWIIFAAIIDFGIVGNSTLTEFIVTLFSIHFPIFYSIYFSLKISNKNGIVNYLLRLGLIIVSLSICFFIFYLFVTHYYTVNTKAGKVLPKLTLKAIMVSFLSGFWHFSLFALLFSFFEELLKKREQEKTIQAKRLAAETAFLRAQINPHFLLNTLNFFYASALLGKGKELAGGILKLSDIMRFSLTKNSDQLSALKDEVNFIRSYMELNQMRFNNELSALLTLPTEEEISNAKIVPLVLITLVENVFKHGELQDKENPVEISLILHRNDGYLKFYAKNKKRQGPKEDGNGIGIENSLARLQNEYDKHFKFTVNEDTQYYEAVLEIWDASIQ